MYIPQIKYLLILCVPIVYLFGCSSPKDTDREYTYFGGEIVNPNTDYIVLTKDNSVFDTIYLNKNNQFLHRMKDFEEGLYSFKHSPENQLVILEKGDSILIRLNTLEFDESLVFTGDGARKNNFLIDMFLENETERERLKKRDFRLPPLQFKNRQDSLLNLRVKRFNKLTHKYQLSNISKKICRSSFDYDFYSRYEMYFYRYQYSVINKINFLKELPESKELPSSFFEYRNDVNFNDDDLKRLYSYNRFLNQYFTNHSFTKYSEKKSPFKNQTGYTIYKLNLVDSTIQHAYIKNNLLRGITSNFILNNKNNYTSKKVLDHYLSIGTNKKFKKELKRLAKATYRLKANNIIPDQELISSDGNPTMLSTLLKKPITALYFWTTENKDHYVKAHKKAKFLSEIYPEIDFIAINKDVDQTKNWLKTLQRHHYDLDREYEFKFPKCSSEELLVTQYNHYINKVILVDQAGRIINPNADLFSNIFERQLISYTQRIKKAASYSLK